MTARFALALIIASLWSPASADDGASPVGEYDGGQVEIAAGLRLNADGRFEYVLSYGALDETATGTWKLAGDAIELTSDPVTAPAFALERSEPGNGRKIKVELATPESIPAQFFAARIRRADGSEGFLDFAAPTASVPFDRNNRPVTIEMAFPMFEVVSPPVPIPSDTRLMRFRFEPNDLGRVAFNRQLLPREEDGYVLERYDRRLVFRKLEDSAVDLWSEPEPPPEQVPPGE